MTYSREFVIRFDAVDQAHVVYYPRYFDYFHRTFEEWFGVSLGASYAHLVLEDNLGFPTVKADAEFLSPVRFGEHMRVDLQLAEIGPRSITMRYTAVRLPDEAVAARATVKKACVDNAAFESHDIPETWRRRLEAFKEGTE
jgi:4-hydroxybenzoyl-CoA thioesterase